MKKTRCKIHAALKANITLEVEIVQVDIDQIPGLRHISASVSTREAHRELPCVIRTNLAGGSRSTSATVEFGEISDRSTVRAPRRFCCLGFDC